MYCVCRSIPTSGTPNWTSISAALVSPPNSCATITPLLLQSLLGYGACAPLLSLLLWSSLLCNCYCFCLSLSFTFLLVATALEARSGAPLDEERGREASHRKEAQHFLFATAPVAVAQLRIGYRIGRRIGRAHAERIHDVSVAVCSCGGRCGRRC